LKATFKDFFFTQIEESFAMQNRNTPPGLGQEREKTKIQEPQTMTQMKRH